MAERTLALLLKAVGAAQAAALVNKVDQSVVKLGSRSGTVSKLGGAFSHAGKQIGGLVGSLGPLIGVTGGLGLAAAFGTSLTKATEFGVTVSKLQGVLDLDAETTSALVDTLDKFGISGDKQVTVLGRMEKNVAALASTQDKAAKFQADYGFNLLDTNGKIADANTLLLRAADYYKSNATATDKATVLNKLYGKTWADMIPVLDLGSAGIKEEEKNAIHLTKTQLENISKFKVAQRDFADVIGDLQVKVGAELMPAITGALKEASTWLDAHSDDVVQFFKGAADFGAQLADGAGKAFGAIKAGWDLIPGPLKTLLIQGFAVGKVSKFLFDFGPMDFAKALGGLGGSIFKRGGTPATPLFVSDVSGGLGKLAGAGGAAEAGGLLGVGGLAGLATITSGVLGILGAYWLIGEVAKGNPAARPVEALPGKPGAFTMPSTGYMSADALGRGIPNYQTLVQQFGGGQYNGGKIGDYGAPRPGYGMAQPRQALPTGEDARKNLAMAAILQRATNAGFRPTQAAVTATYERNIERSTALTARRSEELKTTVANSATTIVNGIVSAIRGMGQPIVNVNVTASDIQKIQTQRRRTVKANGPRNRMVGATEFDG